MHQYHDFGVFVGYLDHSQSIRLSKGGGLNLGRAKEVRQNFCKSCQAVSEPKFFACLGGADDLVIATVDNLPKLARTASWTPELVTYTLSFVPRIDDSGKDEDKLLVSPKELLLLENSQFPVTSVVHMKLSGLSHLVFGVDLQFAAFEAVCQRITNAIHMLGECSPPVDSDLLNAKDIKKSLRFSLLDPLAAEDIVLVFRGNNYSAIAFLVSAVRSLKIGDLLNEKELGGTHRWSNKYRQKLVQVPEATSSIHKKFLTCVMERDGDSSLVDELGENHLFISSYSTLAVGSCSPDSELLETDLSKAIGYVKVLGFADVSPGHDIQVREKIQSASGNPSIASPYKVTDFVPGRHDELYSLCPNGNNSQSGQYLATADCFQRFSDLFRAKSSNNKLAESGFQDLTTCLAVPVPDFSDWSGGWLNELSSLMTPVLDKNHHFDGMVGLATGAEGLRVRLRIRQPEILDEALRKMGLSAGLRASIILLIGEFSVAVEDPLLFDSVIDLHDPFIALVNYVCDSFPAYLKTLEPRIRKTECHKHCPVIIEAAEGLKNAFYLRTERASAKKDDRDTRVQAKGSLNNLLACSDTALKCGLGVVRFSLFGGEGRSLKAKHSTCGVLAPQLNRKSRVRIASLPKTNQSSIAIVTTDAASLFRPEHLVRVLHETAHLLFESCVCSDHPALQRRLNASGNFTDKKNEPQGRAWFSWYSELFAETFVYLFVFANDFDSFAKATLLTFDELSSELQIIGGTTIERNQMVHRLEVLFRLFIVSEWSDKSLFDSGDDFSVPNGLELKEDRFSQFVTKYYGGVSSSDKVAIKKVSKLIFEGRSSHFSFATNYICKSVVEQFELYFDNVGVSKRERESITKRLENLVTIVDSAVNDELKEELTIVFTIVRLYLKWLLDGLDSGKISFDSCDGEYEWRDNATRRDHMHIYTKTVKSLWQVSSRQRLRRLFNLFDLNTES